MAAKGNYVDILLDPVTEGMISDGVLSHYVAPAGSVSYLENFHNDNLGVLTSRPPLAVKDYTPAAQPLSCTLFTQSTTSCFVVWQEGTTIKYAPYDSSGVSPSSYATSASGLGKSRYDTVLGKLIITQYGVGNQPKYTDLTGAPVALGTSFPATNPLDIISAGFIGRVWGAESLAADNRVYYSDVIPAAGLGSLTGGSSYLTINANGTDKVTAFARTQNCLFVFTHNGIFRIFNTQSQDNTPIVNVGTPSQESVVRVKDGYYFFHATGIYKLGLDGAVTETSVKIRDILEKVNPANYDDVIGWSDKDHVYFNLGKSIEGYENTKSWVVRYTISTQVWCIYSFFEFAPLCATSYYAPNYINSFQLNPFPVTYIFGSGITNTSAYYASTFNSAGWTGNSLSLNVNGDLSLYKIYLKAITQWKTFGIEPHVKRISGVAQSHENGAGITLDYLVDKDNKSVWQNIGSLDSRYSSLFRDFQSGTFNRIKFRLQGESLGSPMVVGQTSIIGLDNLGYREN